MVPSAVLSARNHLQEDKTSLLAEAEGVDTFTYLFTYLLKAFGNYSKFSWGLIWL